MALVAEHDQVVAALGGERRDHLGRMPRAELDLEGDSRLFRPLP
jgi:hypothetical protein